MPTSARTGTAWFHLGAAKVVFDFEVADGLVHAITFRADAAVLARVVRRDGDQPVTPGASRSSARRTSHCHNSPGDTS